MATVITTLTQLQEMENDLTADYELGLDINASATSGWNGGEGFDPIGSHSIPDPDTYAFTGSFDGKGYKITNLYINRPAESFAGLFGVVRGSGTIQNVGIEDCNITADSYFGALVGYGEGGDFSISNCWSSGTVDGVDNLIGGLAGYLYLAALSDCYSFCVITVTGGASDVDEIGGLVGQLGGDALAVDSCYFTGSITTTSDDDIDEVGGIAGLIHTGTSLSKCYSTGDIIATSGGTARSIGGFVGNYNTTETISNCYARGDVTASAVDTTLGGVGGFAGAVGSVTAIADDCYSTGGVTATAEMPDVGGFCGINGGTITNCFWDTQTSGQATSDGGTGKTTAQMKTEATFTDAGWDFSTIWSIDSLINNGYPALIGILGAPTVTTQAVSDIATTTAVGNGNITDLGGWDATAHGVCYNTTGSPTISDSVTDEGAATATGAFTTNMTSLTPGTKYYVKAYATNLGGTSYGSEVNFTAYLSPTVITQTCERVVGATATGRGNITTLGVPDPTAHGHCWAETADPTTSDSVVDNGAASAIGIFTSSITGLTPGTGYYTRAYATNSVQTSYGANVYFIAPSGAAGGEIGSSGSRAGYTWMEGQHRQIFNENAIEISLEDKDNPRILAFTKMGRK